MRLIHYSIGILLIFLASLIILISQQKVENSEFENWELKILTFIHGDDFEFGSFEKGLMRDVEITIPSIPNIDIETIPIFLKNNSLSSFFTLSFDQPFIRENLEIIEFYAHRQDTITPNIYGCGTGLVLKKIEINQKISAKTSNPYETYLNEIKFRPNQQTIPDSVHIRSGIVSFSMPWSIYRSEYIFSNPMRINQQKIAEDLLKFLDMENK